MHGIRGLYAPLFFYKYLGDRLMDILDKKTSKEILAALLPEIAKASHELKCARNDLAKATNRINFMLVLANRLIERQEIEQ